MGGNSGQGALTETVFYILLSLCSPLHGYGIMQRVKELSGGRVLLGAGTLYGAISTLETKGWIQPIQPSDLGGRKKEYCITYSGKELLKVEMDRLEELLANGRSILARSE